MIEIPIARPRMPRAEELLPWLQRIDEARSYTNFGPLVTELEARLATRLDIDPACVATVSNATSGLTLALQSVAAGRPGVCLIPSWTFVATAHAVVVAGLTPFLVDVDIDSWAMTPAIALEAVARIDEPVAAVMPVAPFGAPLDMAAWDRFTALTGVPVVIDAAAGHDRVGTGDTPAVVSLHATKVLGAGEGGYVVCRRPELVTAIRQRSNFGFHGSRDAGVVAFNAKMSEYHAAVGLASMAAYVEDSSHLRRLAQAYRDGLPGVELQPGFGAEWIGSTCVARFPGQDGRVIAERLREAGVDSRAWWGEGVHRQTAFADLPSLGLPVTQLLARETIGLPFFVDMTQAQVESVCAPLRDLRSAPLRRAA